MESADRSIDLRNLAQRDSLIEPLREIYGVSDKVLAMGCPTVQSNVSANFSPVRPARDLVLLVARAASMSATATGSTTLVGRRKLANNWLD
jgi:hypothetical protein